MKVFIADDHAIVREGLKRIVEETPHMEVAGEATNGADAVRLVLANDYDVALFDISMPEKTGLEALQEVRSQRPDLPVLMLSIHPEDQYAIRAMQLGASGYLTKESAATELIKALERVRAGGKYITPTLAERLAEAIEHGADKPLHERLTSREYEVMCMIASGKTVRQIALDLDLSIKTIHTHRYRILEKMDLSTNTDLARYAIKAGLVD